MGNLTDFGRTELESAGLFSAESDYDGMLGTSVMELLEVFGKQGHSGFSAMMVTNLFNKLARYQPIQPLTGEDSEWNEVTDGVYQNRRCHHVFKENGQAYDIDGKVFREPDGSTYTNRDSRVDVTFPYTPVTETVDVLE